MKRKLNILTVLYLIFLFLLFLSGSIPGLFGELIYLLAFALPLGVGIYISRGEPCHGELGIDREKLKFTAPLIMPTVGVTVVLSYVTSLLIYLLTGVTSNVDLGDSLFIAILDHALMPALLEEILFRYLPMRFLSNESQRSTVIASAFFFAFVHHDLFSIPYAFVAGIILMTVALATGSVIPSIIIHFINNALSVCAIMYGDNPTSMVVLYSVILISALISLIFIIKKRSEYREAVEFILMRDGEKSITAEMILFALTTLGIAVFSLI